MLSGLMVLEPSWGMAELKIEKQIVASVVIVIWGIGAQQNRNLNDDPLFALVVVVVVVVVGLVLVLFLVVVVC